jgi:hypothetical protein
MRGTQISAECVRDLVLDALVLRRRTTGRARTARAISSRRAVVAGPWAHPPPQPSGRRTSRRPCASWSPTRATSPPHPKGSPHRTPARRLRLHRPVRDARAQRGNGDPARAHPRLLRPGGDRPVQQPGPDPRAANTGHGFQQRLDELTRKIRRAKRPAGASRRRRDRPPHCRASTRAYALIVARPFLLLLAAAFAGNRVYRRHADQRLLERA